MVNHRYKFRAVITPNVTIKYDFVMSFLFNKFLNPTNKKRIEPAAVTPNINNSNEPTNHLVKIKISQKLDFVKKYDLTLINSQPFQDSLMNTKNKGFKTLLLNRRTEVLEISHKSIGDRAPVELDQNKVGRLSRMDAIQLQAMAEAIEKRRKIELHKIETALLRLEEGEYGYCLSCGDEIDLKRLELDPAASQCTNCASSTKH